MSNLFAKFQNIFEGKSEQFKGYSKYKGKVANELLKDEYDISLLDYDTKKFNIYFLMGIV